MWCLVLKGLGSSFSPFWGPEPLPSNPPRPWGAHMECSTTPNTQVNWRGSGFQSGNLQMEGKDVWNDLSRATRCTTQFRDRQTQTGGENEERSCLEVKKWVSVSCQTDSTHRAGARRYGKHRRRRFRNLSSCYSRQTKTQKKKKNPDSRENWDEIWLRLGSVCVPLPLKAPPFGSSTLVFHSSSSPFFFKLVSGAC